MSSAFGPTGGLFAILTVGIAFAVVLTLSFEVARTVQAFDYRSFFAVLLPRSWIAYEILLVVSIPLVLAVNAAAASEIMRDQLRLPGSIGVVLTFGVVVVISYLGRDAVRNSLATAAAALVIVLSITAATAYATGADDIRLAFASATTSDDWLTSATQYTLYNVAVIPLILYSARDIGTRRDSLVCGIVAAIAGVFPALVFSPGLHGFLPGDT